MRSAWISDMERFIMWHYKQKGSQAVYGGPKPWRIVTKKHPKQIYDKKFKSYYLITKYE